MTPDPTQGSEQSDFGFGSAEAGAKGGKARAAKLSKEARSAIARKGGLARHSAGRPTDQLPKAMCGGEQPLRLGMLEVPCYVLDDERRVITMRGMQAALGMSTSGGAPRMAILARSIALTPSQGNDLAVRLESPIEFVMPQGGVAHGYEGLLLVNIAETILDARRAGVITPRYAHIAQAAEILLAAFASVGIIALIDEATGYQNVRRRLALAELLDNYISDKMNFWTKTFPDEFYEEYFRLQSWDSSKLRAGDGKPAEIGKFTRDVVYRRMHPWIVRELEEKNPCIVPGRRMYKHHMWLSQELGHPALKEHLAKIITIMKLSTDMLDFNQKLTKVLGQAGDQGFFDEFFRGEN
jgi:hypothetical protein